MSVGWKEVGKATRLVAWQILWGYAYFRIGKVLLTKMFTGNYKNIFRELRNLCSSKLTIK